MSEKHLSTTRFNELNLHGNLLKGIEELGFDFCTPIQADTLPIALNGKDVTGQAQTGTGKTAAFLIATLQHLLTNPQDESAPKTQLRALILAPTRELAIQIFDDGKPLVKYTGLKLGLAYGGTDYEKQRKKLEKGVDILIGTPGRVIDYMKQNVFSLGELQVMVLDEADRMFDLGFIKDIRYVFRQMPEPAKRLNMMFSATLSHRVNELAYEHMNEPTEIKIEAENITAERINERGYMPSNQEKVPLLMGLLKQVGNSRSVVFVNTKHAAEEIQAWLESNDFKSGLLSGDVPQRKRERLLKEFKDGKITTLVATDVAARGLHIPDVTHVFNYDLPTDAEDYVHRIGRTARAGASGTAVSLICETYAMNLLDIEEYVEHKIDIEKDYQTILFNDAKKPDFSALNKRNSKKKTGKKVSKKKTTSQKSKPQHRDKPQHHNKPQKTEKPQEKTSTNTNVFRLRSRRNNKEIPAIG